MNTPIMTAVEKYTARGCARMHMPGHKGNMKGIFGDIAKYDLTEVTGLDSLYECDGCILKCEEEYSKIYGSKKSIISAGGSSLCIQTMLALAGKPGGKIIAGRNIHISAVNAMGLLDLSPVWVYPEGKSGTGIPGIISPLEIKRALEENPDACAVYITTPDYFGVLSDVGAIAKICKKYGIPLLVDNAHGAGLKFLEKSLHPMDLGADMCCDSLHKTMPVFTGGAILHINHEKFTGKAKSAMSIFGSTSPSYLIMESIDMALEYIKNKAYEDFTYIQKWIEKMKKTALEHGFEVPLGLCDPSKFAFNFGSLGYSREKFYEILCQNKIEPEYMSENYCVFMPSPFNSPWELKKVENLIKTTPKIGKPENLVIEYEKPQTVMSVRKAMFSPSERVKTENSAGRIAARTKSKCPPGIPLLIPGEKITEKIVNILISYGIFDIDVLQ